MGNACFKPVDADTASAASTSTSKPHPELTTSSPDSKRVSATSHFDSPSRSPKAAGAKGGERTPALDDGLGLKYDADAVLVQEDSILSCTCSDVITSPQLDGGLPKARHSRHPSREQSPQAGPSAQVVPRLALASLPDDAAAPPEPQQTEAVDVQCAGPVSAESRLRNNAIFIPHDEDAHARARHADTLACEAAAVAHAYGRADDAGDSTSGILGVRDPGMLKGSPFAEDSGELHHGGAPCDVLFEDRGGDSLRLQMPRSAGDAEVATPRFSLQWSSVDRDAGAVGRRPASIDAGRQAARDRAPAQPRGAQRSKADGKGSEHEAAVEAAIAAAAAAAELLEGSDTVRLGDEGGFGRSASLPTRSYNAATPAYMASPTPTNASAMSAEQLQAVVASQAQLIAQQRYALQMGSNSMMSGGSMMGGNSLMGGNSMMGSMHGVPMMPGFASPPKLDQILRMKQQDAIQRSASYGLRLSNTPSPMVTALLGRDGKARSKHSRNSSRHGHARGAGMSRTHSGAPARSESASRTGSAGMSRVTSAAMSRTTSGAQPLGRAASGAARPQNGQVGSRTSSASSLSVAPMGNFDGAQARSNSTSTVASSSAARRGVDPALRSGSAQRRM